MRFIPLCRTDSKVQPCCSSVILSFLYIDQNIRSSIFSSLLTSLLRLMTRDVILLLIFVPVVEIMSWPQSDIHDSGHDSPRFIPI